MHSRRSRSDCMTELAAHVDRSGEWAHHNPERFLGPPSSSPSVIEWIQSNPRCCPKRPVEPLSSGSARLNVAAMHGSDTAKTSTPEGSRDMRPVEHWFFRVDARSGELLRGHRTAQGHPHLQSVEMLENIWEAHQRSRPSPRQGKNGHSYASIGHEQEERRRRFTKGAGQWLESRMTGMNCDEVLVLAPARFIGEARLCWTDALLRRVNLREADLNGVPMRRLLQHPMIRERLGTNALIAV